MERLIRHTYQSHSKYGLMIKTLFLSGARCRAALKCSATSIENDDEVLIHYVFHGSQDIEGFLFRH